MTQSARLRSKDRQGLDGLEALVWLPSHPNVFAIIADLITITYAKLLPAPASDFVAELLRFLRAIEPSLRPLDIFTRLERLRRTFAAHGLAAYYATDFRKQNLEDSLSLAPSDLLSGSVLDVGADDNRAGEVLESFDGVLAITGIDIEDRPGRFSSNRAAFVAMPEPKIIPLPSLAYNTAICRYSLHHMPKSVQVAILDEIYRCLRPQGVLLIWENCLSETQPPEQCFAPPILERIHRLHSEERRVLLSAMDVVSFAIKKKYQPFPFAFRTLEEWRCLLDRRWRILVARYIGLPLLDLHQVPLGLLIVQKP